MRTVSQSMLAASFAAVSNMEPNAAGSYKRAVQKISGLLQPCGVLQALAFANSKPEFKRVLDDLQAMPELAATCPDLVAYLRSCPAREYMILSRRARQGLEFLKIAAETIENSALEVENAG
jgi:hypothetical protein